MDDDQWSGAREDYLKAWNQAIRGSIVGFSPGLVVYDTLVPLGVIEAVSSASEKPKEAFILRKRNNLKQFFIDNQKIFDRVELIVFPHDRDEIEIEEIPEQFRNKTFFSGAVIRRDTNKVELEPIKEKYNILNSEINIVVTNGGGNSVYDDGFTDLISRVFNHLDQRLPKYKLFVFTGPLLQRSIESIKLKNGKLIMNDYEPLLIDLMAASNLVICRGGYNTVNECAALGVPTISIPSFRTSDDQRHRVSAYSQKYQNIIQVGLEQDQISKTILSAINKDKWQFNPKVYDKFYYNKKELAQKILSL